MTNLKHCQHCGVEMSSDFRWETCPKCLLDLPAAGNDAERNDRGESYFAHYRMIRQIGRGGMGVVYEAVHLKIHRKVALKKILESQWASDEARRRFAIEAEAIAKLDHPNIVPMYEVGEHEGVPFLSMKLVPGESLKVWMARGAIGLGGGDPNVSKHELRQRATILVNLIARIARAVHHAHDKGVLHRDLKPGNILMDKEGTPYLTDFGLAKFLANEPGVGYSTMTQSNFILGTPSYMSPEQARNHRVNVASDVYGLGAIFYELLTGQPPCQGTSVLETMRLVLEQAPRRPREIYGGVDTELETICLKCLEKDPRARYHSALALAEDLERWLEQKPILARPAGPLLRTRRWIQRNPVGTGLIVSLCACLIVSLLFIRFLYDQAAADRIARSLLQEDLQKTIERVWDDPNEEFVRIRSREWALLRGLELRESVGDPLTLTFCVQISQDPVGQAERYAQFLSRMEVLMEKELNRRVAFDLILSKLKSWGTLYGARMDVDIQAVSFLTHERLRKNSPSLIPLVKTRFERHGIIFARADLGISNLAQAAGHRVAFAHDNSVISELAKKEFARAGLCANSFSLCTNVGLATLSEDDDFLRLAHNESTSKLGNYAHYNVVEMAVAGEIDVGVTPSKGFVRNEKRGPGLVELMRFPITPDIYVTKEDTDPVVVRAMRKSLLALSDVTLLAPIKRAVSAGFAPLQTEELDEFHQWMTNELEYFESCHRLIPVPSP